MKLIQHSFRDIDALCEMVETWKVELIPVSAYDRGEDAGVIIQTGDLDCQYMYCEFSPGLSMYGSPPPGLITFNLQEPTKRPYWWRGHDLDSATAWVFPFGGELHSISAPGFRVHTLSVTEESVAEIAAESGIDLPPVSKRPEIFPVPHSVLQKARLRLKAMRDMASPFSTDNAQEILRLLVPLWLRREPIKNCGRATMRARDRAVRKSLEIMEATDLQTLTLATLLDECCVSERTLQLAFHERFATSPAAFIKSLRLVRARSALRRAAPGTQNVGDIAATFGFWHLSQFASDYCRKFGELPSETLAEPRKKFVAGLRRVTTV